MAAYALPHAHEERCLQEAQPPAMAGSSLIADNVSEACCAGQDIVDRAMDQLDALAELDLDSPACQQAAASAAPALIMQQPKVSLRGLQSSSLLEEVQGSGQLLSEGGSGTAADCDVHGGPRGAVEEGAAGAAHRTEDAGAMSALQLGQSVYNPFSRSFPSPKASHDDSVGAQVEHLKQVRLRSALVDTTASLRLTSATLHFAGRDIWRVDQKHFKTSICKAAGRHLAHTCAAMTDMLIYGT